MTYTIMNKQEIYLNRKKHTQFDVYEEDENARFFVGQYAVKWVGLASDERCLDAFYQQRAEEEFGDEYAYFCN